MKGKALIVVGALAAVLLIVVIILAVALIGAGNEGLTERNMEAVAESAAEEVLENFNVQNKNEKENIPEDKPIGCPCAEGTPVQYVPRNAGCTHTVLCDECRLTKGEEKCEIIDGICIACGSAPVHTYEVIESSKNDEGKEIHTKKCAVCDEKLTEECVFTGSEQCLTEGCENKCPHTARTLSGEMTEGKHEEICTTCGKIVNVQTPAPGEKCPTCHVVREEADPSADEAEQIENNEN